MTFKDKAKWFSFEMSFILAQSYACACAYVDTYVDAYAGTAERFYFGGARSHGCIIITLPPVPLLDTFLILGIISKPSYISNSVLYLQIG